MVQYDTKLPTSAYVCHFFFLILLFSCKQFICFGITELVLLLVCLHRFFVFVFL